MKNSGLSRRDFVKFSAIGATALGMGATNLMATPMNEKDVKWDEEYDVVIIGSGFAALAAGVTSAKKRQQSRSDRKNGSHRWQLCHQWRNFCRSKQRHAKESWHQR